MASICVKEFALRRDAQHYAHLIDVDRGAGSYIDPRLGRITVAEWFERWWPTVTTLRPSTRGIRSHVLPSTTTGTSSPNTYPDMMQKTGRFNAREDRRVVGEHRRRYDSPARGQGDDKQRFQGEPQCSSPETHRPWHRRRRSGPSTPDNAGSSFRNAVA